MQEKIEKFVIEWGKISFDGSELRDIIFVEGKVIQRDQDSIRSKYGTSHVVDLNEARILLKGNPAEVIIGSGFEGKLKLTPDAQGLLKQRTALIILTNPQSVELLNEKIRRGVKVSALIHTTC
jgi:hypothetical protein